MFKQAQMIFFGAVISYWFLRQQIEMKFLLDLVMTSYIQNKLQF